MTEQPAAHISTSPYNPYNGNEALKLIFRRIWDQCEQHQMFAQHLTYTQFEMEFQLKFKGESIEATVVKGEKKFELRPREATITVTGNSPAAPDDGRREAGVPVPSAQLSQGGMVDITLQQQTLAGGQP